MTKTNGWLNIFKAIEKITQTKQATQKKRVRNKLELNYCRNIESNMGAANIKLANKFKLQIDFITQSFWGV